MPEETHPVDFEPFRFGLIPFGLLQKNFWMFSIKGQPCSRIKTLFLTRKQTKNVFMKSGPVPWCRVKNPGMLLCSNTVRIFSVFFTACTKCFTVCLHVFIYVYVLSFMCTNVCLCATVGCRRGYILQQLSCMRRFTPLHSSTAGSGFKASLH